MPLCNGADTPTFDWSASRVTCLTLSTWASVHDYPTPTGRMPPLRGSMRLSAGMFHLRRNEA